MKITEEGRELGLRHHYFRNWIEKKREKKKKKKNCVVRMEDKA